MLKSGAVRVRVAWCLPCFVYSCVGVRTGACPALRGVNKPVLSYLKLNKTEKQDGRHYLLILLDTTETIRHPRGLPDSASIACTPRHTASSVPQHGSVSGQQSSTSSRSSSAPRAASTSASAHASTPPALPVPPASPALPAPAPAPTALPPPSTETSTAPEPPEPAAGCPGYQPANGLMWPAPLCCPIACAHVAVQQQQQQVTGKKPRSSSIMRSSAFFCSTCMW